jgi:hypothetical protein
MGNRTGQWSHPGLRSSFPSLLGICVIYYGRNSYDCTSYELCALARAECSSGNETASDTNYDEESRKALFNALIAIGCPIRVEISG